MTDNEIIKAYELCRLKHCSCTDGCPYRGKSGIYEGQECFTKAREDLFDLITRQKAEIERLEEENKLLSENADTAFQDGLNEAQDLYREQVKSEVRAEAIKEFAERLKEKDGVPMNTVDNLVKEMVGDKE